MKYKCQIINEIVTNASDIMEAKAEEMECIAQQFDAKADTERAERLRKDVQEIGKAIELMRRFGGCWA
jgi:hypothetical protein